MRLRNIPALRERLEESVSGTSTITQSEVVPREKIQTIASPQSLIHLPLRVSVPCRLQRGFRVLKGTSIRVSEYYKDIYLVRNHPTIHKTCELGDIGEFDSVEV